MTSDVMLELLVEEDNSNRTMLENALLPMALVVHNEIVVVVVAEELIHDWKEFRQYSEQKEKKIFVGNFWKITNLNFK